ncbi:hypothetical protein V144x_11020 [Gimesia aquarii]|uniref:Uncharacterized protein n=1 Tax=Gimesia aquarii TaxID=2527964 RepID=A0A517VRJ6_9PLAN|nr:hypothetical protein V144x_11020 [Gimesia aquarii]
MRVSELTPFTITLKFVYGSLSYLKEPDNSTRNVIFIAPFDRQIAIDGWFFEQITISEQHHCFPTNGSICVWGCDILRKVYIFEMNSPTLVVQPK